MYEKFLKIKWKLNREINKNKGNLLFIDRGRYYPAFVFSILACAFSKKYKLNNIILTDLNKNSSIIKIYNSLGFKKFVKSFDKLYFFKLNIFLKSLFITILTIVKIYNSNFLWFIKKFKINNIPIGDLIYDLFIRVENNFKRTKPNIYFIKLLFKSIFRFLMIEKIIKKKNIKFIFCCTEFYAGNDGLALRISTFKKIKNIIVWHDSRGNLKGIQNLKKIIFNKGPHSYYRNIELRKNVKNKIISKAIINKFLKKRKNFKTSNTYTINSFIKANNFDDNNTNNFIKKLKRKNKKIVLFACHALSDAAHGIGIDYAFSNYYDQLKVTLDFVNKNKNDKKLWIFKSHPSSRELNEDYIIRSLVNSYNNKNFIFCPLDIKTNKLVDVSDFIISGRGTIALEAACEGKIAINCGFSTFSNLNLIYEANSKNKYLYYLKNLHNLKNPDIKKIERAKKTLYLLENNLINEWTINKNIKNYKINKIFTHYVEDKYFLSKMYLKHLNNKNMKNIINILSKSI